MAGEPRILKLERIQNQIRNHLEERRIPAGLNDTDQELIVRVRVADAHTLGVKGLRREVGLQPLTHPVRRVLQRPRSVAILQKNLHQAATVGSSAPPTRRYVLDVIRQSGCVGEEMLHSDFVRAVFTVQHVEAICKGAGESDARRSSRASSPSSTSRITVEAMKSLVMLAMNHGCRRVTGAPSSDITPAYARPLERAIPGGDRKDHGVDVLAPDQSVKQGVKAVYMADLVYAAPRLSGNTKAGRQHCKARERPGPHPLKLSVHDIPLVDARASRPGQPVPYPEFRKRYDTDPDARGIDHRPLQASGIRPAWVLLPAARFCAQGAADPSSWELREALFWPRV
jgi:hypothetical protein